MQSQKSSLRKKYREKRDSFFQNRKELHRAYSKIIEEKLIRFITLSKLKKVCCFLSTTSEIDTKNLIQELLLKEDCRVFLPTIQAKRKLAVKELEANLPLQKQLSPEPKFGILEPKSEYCRAYYGDIDIIVTPGLVFDEQGNRLGYGGGYYDAFLSEHGEALGLGIFFHFQKHEGLSSFIEEGYDKKLSHIITEKKEYLHL